MALAVFLAIATASSFMVEKIPQAPQHFYPGSKVQLLPFNIVKNDKNDVFTVKAVCKSTSEEVSFCPVAVTGPASKLNDHFRNERYIVPQNAISPIKVVLEVENIKTNKKVTVSNTLTLADQIAVNMKITRTSPKATFPLRIAEILPPFSDFPLAIHVLGRNPGFNFTIFNGGVEIYSLTPQASGNVTFWLSTPNNEIKSQHLTVDVVSVGKVNRRRIFYIILGVSIVIISAIVASIYVQGKKTSSTQIEEVGSAPPAHNNGNPNIITIKTVPIESPTLIG